MLLLGVCIIKVCKNAVFSVPKMYFIMANFLQLEFETKTKSKSNNIIHIAIQRLKVKTQSAFKYNEIRS